MYLTVFISTFSDPNQDQNIRGFIVCLFCFVLSTESYLSRNKSRLFLYVKNVPTKIHCLSLYPIHWAKGLGRRGKKPIPLKEQNQITLICQECSNKKKLLVALPHTWGLGRRGKKLIPLKEQNQITLICQEFSSNKKVIGRFTLYVGQRALVDGAKSQQGRFAPNVRRISTCTNHEGQLQK